MTGSTTSVDWKRVRDEFPILRREIDGAPIVYLDSGNTSQKPRQVIDAMSTFLEQSYAPINRSSYRLAGEATDAYEHGRLSCPRDPALSVHFYTGAAERGHAAAMMGLCAWYMVGADPILEKDEEEAYEWARRSAELGMYPPTRPEMFRPIAC